MRIGRLYRVLGIPAHVHQWPSITWSVEANSVQPWEPECKAVNDLILNPAANLQKTHISTLRIMINQNNVLVLYTTSCIETYRSP